MRRVLKKVVLNKQIPKQPTRRPGGTQRVSRQQNIYQQFPNKGNKLNLCVIRSLGGIGDILMTTPAIQQLAEDYPNSRITYATDMHSTKDYYEVLKNNPHISEVIDARFVNKTHYDAWVDITSVCIQHENSSKPVLNRIDIFAKAIGISRLRNTLPYLKLEPEETLWAQSYIRQLNLGDKKLIYLHTASFDPQRCWPVQRYQELLRIAQNQYPNLHFLVSDFNQVLPNKQLYPNATDVTQGLIRKASALIQQSDYFIGPDSGPMHIAGALQVPSLAMFGSIPPAARINYYPTHTAVTSEPKLSCMPCFYSKCSINFKCMTNITAEQVLKTLMEKL